MTAAEKRHRFWKIVLIVAIVWIFVLPTILLAAFSAYQFAKRDRNPRPNTVAVPKLQGLQIDAARKAGHEAGFQVEVAGKDFESQVKPGTVTMQEPWAGTFYAKGTPISVLVAETDPHVEFWKEQERKHTEFKKKGYFKEFEKKR